MSTLTASAIDGIDPLRAAHISARIDRLPPLRLSGAIRLLRPGRVRLGNLPWSVPRRQPAQPHCRPLWSRAIFTFALIWYTAATVLMACAAFGPGRERELALENIAHL